MINSDYESFENCAIVHVLCFTEPTWFVSGIFVVAVFRH